VQDEELLQQLQGYTPQTPKEFSWEICWQDFGITPEFLT